MPPSPPVPPKIVRTERRRLRRGAKWVGVTASIAMMVAMGVGLFWGTLWVAPNGIVIGYTNGCLEVGDVGVPHGWYGVPPNFRAWRNPPSGFRLLPRRFSVTPGTIVLVPLWFPFLVIVVPTALLFRADHRAAKRGRIGRCPKCNYDLAGLTPASSVAVCPECGTARGLPASRG